MSSSYSHRHCILTVGLTVSQDDVIRKYDLSSVTLETFFLGPLPESLVSVSSRSPSPPVRPPTINGCFSTTDLRSADRDNGGPVLNDGAVIDLTEDDFDSVPTAKTSPAGVAKKRVRTKNSSSKKNRRTKPGWLVVLFIIMTGLWPVFLDCRYRQ